MSEVKNILVLTSIYPADDIPKGWTPVVHYFTKEWVKQVEDYFWFMVDGSWLMVKRTRITLINTNQ